MTATRLELAIDAMEIEDLADDIGCDDIRPAWLCAELNRGRASVRDSFDAAWIDR